MKLANLFVDNETITLDREGQWLSNGEEITHGETLKFFYRNIKKIGHKYHIVNGREKKEITVEDTPYFVVNLDGDSNTGFKIRLSDGTSEKLDPNTLEYEPGRLICKIKSREETAKFLRKSYYEILSYCEKRGEKYVLEIQGRTYEFRV